MSLRYLLILSFDSSDGTMCSALHNHLSTMTWRFSSSSSSGGSRRYRSRRRCSRHRCIRRCCGRLRCFSCTHPGTTPHFPTMTWSRRRCSRRCCGRLPSRLLHTSQCWATYCHASYLAAFFFPIFRRQSSLPQSPLLRPKRCISRTHPGARRHFSVLLGGFLLCFFATS